MTKIYFVRHCEAQGNTLGILQGRFDSDISGNSAKQLDLVSLRLRNVPFDAIYSSPLQRAYKTAQAINQYHHLEIRKDPRLTEIDMGDWEGHSWDDLAKKYPDIIRVWNEDTGHFTAPGGESVVQVRDRMWAAANAIADANPGKTVCAVSHGCAIRSFLCEALGKPLSEMNTVPWGDNTAVSVVEVENGKARVLSMNDASHIPPDLSVYRHSSDPHTAIDVTNVAP